MATPNQFPFLYSNPRYSQGDYLDMLHKLFPRGKIWGFMGDRANTEILQDIIGGEPLQTVITGPDSIQNTINTPSINGVGFFSRFLSVFADELYRLEMRAWTLFNETTAGLSTELLPEWERCLGLPDHCTLLVMSDLNARRRAVHAKEYGGGATATYQYYVDMGATLGFTVHIEDPTTINDAAVCDIAICGVTVCGGTGNRCEYIVHVTAGPDDDNAYAQLQCIFSDIKAAHITLSWVDER